MLRAQGGSATRAAGTRLEVQSYTAGMKTAISLPDDLFYEAEKIAAADGKTRSQLYREALSAYIAKRDTRSLTEAMNKALEGIDQTPDPWMVEAARQTFQRSEW